MPVISASAPGKIILFGEHAVVYGHPAIAVPVTQVRARAVVIAQPGAGTGQIRIQAPDVGLDSLLDELPGDHPFSQLIILLGQALGLARFPACTVRVGSTIPVASGLGSGAAVTVAIVRALTEFVGKSLTDDQVNALAFEIEKVFHGTPSGIDNSVVTYARPIYFIRGEPIQVLDVAQPFTILIGDTGVPSPTAVAVGDLRRAWQDRTQYYEELFDSVGEIVVQARQLIVNCGTTPVSMLGRLMNVNHDVLRRMGVSSEELDHLVDVARDAGAMGAKMSGGGRGGNMIALVDPIEAPAIAKAIERAGAVRTIITPVTNPLSKGMEIA